MLSKKNSMVTMVTDEFLENRIILQKSVAAIGFIWFFWFQKGILLYIFAQGFLVMRSIRSHISLFRLGFTPTLTWAGKRTWNKWLTISHGGDVLTKQCFPNCRQWTCQLGLLLDHRFYPESNSFQVINLLLVSFKSFFHHQEQGKRRTWVPVEAK